MEKLSDLQSSHSKNPVVPTLNQDSLSLEPVSLASVTVLILYTTLLNAVYKQNKWMMT